VVGPRVVPKVIDLSYDAFAFNTKLARDVTVATESCFNTNVDVTVRFVADLKFLIEEDVGPVHLTLLHVILNQPSHHYDAATILFPHHPPECTHRIGGGSLCCDVSARNTVVPCDVVGVDVRRCRIFSDLLETYTRVGVGEDIGVAIQMKNSWWESIFADKVLIKRFVGTEFTFDDIHYPIIKPEETTAIATD
jgi:hypothetical protein